MNFQLLPNISCFLQEIGLEKRLYHSKDHISLFEIDTPSQLLWSQCGGAIMGAGPGSLAQVDALALWQLWQQAIVNTLSPACRFQANFQLLLLEDW